MPVITQTIALNERRPEVTAIQKALLSVGYTIGPAELYTTNVDGKFGEQTQGVLVDFIGPLVNLDEVGDPFNAAWGRLLHVAVPAELGNSAALHLAASECLAVIEVPPALSWSELSSLAKYSVMGRNFTSAKQIIDEWIGPDPVLKALVDELAGQTPKPDLLNPENYYTFVYDYVSAADIKALMQGSKVRTR